MQATRACFQAWHHVVPGVSACLLAILLCACISGGGPTGSLIPASSPSEAFVLRSGSPALPDPGRSTPGEGPFETASPPGASTEETPNPSAPTSGLQPGFNSPVFRASAGSLRIPPKYTCDGIDVSPSLEWSIPVAEAISELAIIVTDPDAHGFTHWVVARIPGSDTGLDEGAGDTAAGNGLLQGQNSFGGIGYRGPCPPAGTTHHYQFTLYAFASAPELRDVPTADDVRQAGGSRVVEFVALYGH
jgi:Raf kinase inhibitor-like YbhB/YbcL family protein